MINVGALHVRARKFLYDNTGKTETPKQILDLRIHKHEKKTASNDATERDTEEEKLNARHNRTGNSNPKLFYFFALPANLT